MLSPVGSDGSISLDPLFCDLSGGDLHLVLPEAAREGNDPGMKPSERALYEIRENWERFTLTPFLAEKIRLIGAMLPAGVRTILDVGCGNGLITNALGNRGWVVGLDWSREALAFVQGNRVCASSGALPIRAGRFDLLLSSELLEHLEETDFLATIGELACLAPRYLLLSVPNAENTRVNQLRCPTCGRIFNASHHQRSFTASSLAARFPAYRVAGTALGGQPVRSYPRALLTLRQRLAGRWFQVPPERIVMCPECGNRDFPRTPHNPLSFLFDGLNRLISRRHPYWLFLLLERK